MPPRSARTNPRQRNTLVPLLSAAAAIGVLGSVAVLDLRTANAPGRGRRASAAYAATGRRRGETAATTTAIRLVPAPQGRVPANEMGRIPILMYHSVGEPPVAGKYAGLGLSISAATFRSNLDALYAGGFYPVNVRDLFDPRFSVPAGKTPVALTFDDSRSSQFRFRPDGSVDPNCALGVLEAFHRLHPDWPERATFYVLPDTQYNPPPFGRRDQAKQKLAFLLAHGYEIANHTTTHHRMTDMDAKALRWEMATCAAYVRKIAPSATMETMALPYGAPPRKDLLPLLLDDGTGAYRNRCVLMAAGNPSFVPWDTRFDRLAVPRIGSTPGNIERWIKVLEAERGRAATPTTRFQPYISDGDPQTLTIPQSLAKFVDRSRLGAGMQVVAYADAPKPLTGSANTAVAAAAGRLAAGAATAAASRPAHGG